MTDRFVAVFANTDCWRGVMVEALHNGISSESDNHPAGLRLGAPDCVRPSWA
jgi:hypothetical protein